MAKEPQVDALALAYRACFSTEHGKIVLDDLKRKSTYSRPSQYDGNVNTLIHDEAQRGLVLYILSQIGRPLETTDEKAITDEKEKQ